MNHRYSLVILTSNRPKALEQCLGSIERMEKLDLSPEIVILHDGTKSNLPIFEKFPSLDAKLIFQERTGVSIARNRGLSESTGDFIGFIADDYILPKSFLRDAHNFFSQHPEALVITHNLKPKGLGIFTRTQKIYMQLALGQEIIESHPKDGVASSFTLPAARAAIFRKETFSKVGRFDESIKTGEDSDFARRMAKIKAPVYMFLHKFIEYDEGRSGLDYLKLRVRYGKSFVRVLGGKTMIPVFSKYGIWAVFSYIKNNIGRWGPIANKMGIQLQFIFFLPFLSLFLGFFYYGAFLELKNSGKLKP